MQVTSAGTSPALRPVLIAPMQRKAAAVALSLALSTSATPASAHSAAHATGVQRDSAEPPPALGGAPPASEHPARGSDFEWTYVTIGGAAAFLPGVGWLATRVAEHRRRRRLP